MQPPEEYERMISAAYSFHDPQTPEETAQVSLVYALLAHASAVQELGEKLEEIRAILERRGG